jgi:hypothetical protein
MARRPMRQREQVSVGSASSLDTNCPILELAGEYIKSHSGKVKDIMTRDVRLLTRRWRKTDSNPRSPVRANSCRHHPADCPTCFGAVAEDRIGRILRSRRLTPPTLRSVPMTTKGAPPVMLILVDLPTAARVSGAGPQYNAPDPRYLPLAPARHLRRSRTRRRLKKSRPFERYSRRQRLSGQA